MTQFQDTPDTVLELADDAPPQNAIAAAAAETAGTDIALLPPKQRAVKLFNSEKTEKDLRALVAQSVDIKEVKNLDGRAQVHRMAMNLQKARTGIEKTGKTARDDANAFNKAVLEEQRRLVAITEAEETRVFKLRDDFDAEAKRLADEAAAKEAARKATIDATIDNIRALPVELVNASADEIQVELDAIEELVLEGFTALDEFAEVGMAAARHVRQTLETMQATARAREQMAAQLAEQNRVFEEQKAQMAAQLAELEKQKAELQAQLAAAQTPVDLPAGEQAKTDDVLLEFEVERTASLAPAGWDKIEGDDAPAENMDTVLIEPEHPQYGLNPEPIAGDQPITPAVDARERRIGGGRMAPLDWGNVGEKQVEVQPRQDTEYDIKGFTDAGLSRVAAAVALQSAPLELWVVLEDGEPIVSKTDEAMARKEAEHAINMNPQHTYSIAQYLLAAEHAA